jgi:hypothetical protein
MQLLNGSGDIGLAPWRYYCHVDIGRRNKPDREAFERLDQIGELFSDVRSNFDPDEHANGLRGYIGARNRFDRSHLQCSI